uniref:Putative tail fiber protein n=2 Tax=viral metagenome TaxID=1070528 RepID=A0A6M3INP4_9ZZZZ
MAFYSTTLAVMRQRLSSAVGDLIMGTFNTGTTSTGVDGALYNPKWANDYFNNHGYKAYIYQGTYIGYETWISDWDLATTTLTFSPAFSTAVDATSKYELHYIFTEDEYRKAINEAIDFARDNYLLPITDQTSIYLMRTKDNLGVYVYTYEYNMPSNMAFVHEVITEDDTSGYKLTGTVSGTFTEGETVTGGTSGATGEFTYQNSGSTYIRVRKVSGTFEVGETATGGTSSETCSSITGVTAEPAGMDRWLEEDTIDPRMWNVYKKYPSSTPVLKLDSRYYSVIEDLYLRLNGHRKQPALTADTDICYLPSDWVIQKAITFLPMGKIQNNNLMDVYKVALARSERMPLNPPSPYSRQVMQ